MRMTNQNEDALRDHVFATYVALRFGLAFLGIAFPILLWGVGGLLYGIELQPSMSHYYFAPYPPGNPIETAFPMRGWFVGLLFAIGVGLALYRGFTNCENIALNLAGGFAVLVALVPMDIACKIKCGMSWHGAFAILLFVCLALVAIVCAPATLPYLKADPSMRVRLRRGYAFLGACMFLSPLAALGLTLATGDDSSLVFFVEAFGVWSFAAYWLVKSWEMKKSRAERRALEAELQPPRNQGRMLLPKFPVQPTQGQDAP